MLARTRVWQLTAVLCVVIAAAGGYAQQPASAPSRPSTPARGTLGPAPNFTGDTAQLDTTGYNVGRRVFGPGAHNSTFHTHSAGQLVFCETGTVRLHIKGQPVRDLKVGESAYIPPGVMHWHGSSPTETSTMLYITMGQSTTTQGEPVTDAIYSGK